MTPRALPVALRLLTLGRCLALGACLLSLLLILAPPARAEAKLNKAQVARLLKGQVPRLVQGHPVQLRDPKLGRITVEPTVDSHLQRVLERQLGALKSRRAALVLVEPSSGKVLALAGLRHGRRDPSVALDSSSPAASLFKVVTAAAALEEGELMPGSYLRYVGRAHTLYRFQVREKLRRKPQKVTLAHGFADSNNPVFARLGIFHLGKDVLVEYAQALGFGRALSFDLPTGPSRLVQVQSQFALGEMASGYNRETTMSPLHAALMVSVFLNGGRFPQPYLVRSLTTSNGKVAYRGRPHLSAPVVTADTCQGMQRLFAATIKEGTARKAFNRLYRDRVLKRLELGGKTGTIRGPDRRELFEWFAGYGRDPVSGRTLAVAAMVVHGKVRHANSKRLARLVLREAFRSQQTARK
ncbi:MAG: penicillin-binding transpeptidase domain-containing protein [Thermodesulfobacteriota bacterium]